MKVKGLFTQMSGAFGGFVGSHNRSGLYIRGRAIPTNPSTPQQVAVRDLFSMYQQMWGDTLTAAQRATWDLYASNVQAVNSLGDAIYHTGINWYSALNVPRAQADPTNLPALTDGPAIFDQGVASPPTAAAPNAAAGTVDISFTAADDWVSEDDAAMLVYASRPQGPAVNFFKGPYRLMGTILGDATTPPTSPATMTLPFATVAGQVIHFRARVTRADGRLTPAVTFRGTSV